jgi:hypothetical protein
MLNLNVFPNFFELDVLCAKILADGGARQTVILCSIPAVAIELVGKHANIGNNPPTCLTSIDQAIVFGLL